MGESEADTAEHDEESLTMSTSLRILVVDDDATFLAIISGLLKILKHEVVTFRNPLHALSTLGVKKSYFDLVITDVHMPQIDGFEMQKRVQEDFKLPLIMISADDRESVMLKALQRGVALYIVKPVSLTDLKNIWQYVVTSKKGKKPAFFDEIASSLDDHHHHHHELANLAVGDQSISPAPAHHADDHDHEDDESKNNSASSSSSATNSSKRKKQEDCNQQHHHHHHHHHHHNKNNPAPPPTTTTPTAKKAKVIWTNTLQTRFLEAINFIGLERAVPKKILEAMNVQGLTRENVASHLQKYRLFLKKVAERTRAANSLAAKSKYLNIGLNHSSTILNSRFSGQHQIGGTSSQLRFRDNNLNLNAANLGLGRFHSQGASSSTSVPQFGYRQPNFLSQQPKFGTANPFQQDRFSSVNNGVQPKNIGTGFPVGGRIPHEAMKATNGLANGTANPMQIYQQQNQKNPQLFNTAGSLDYNFGSSSGTPNSNYISTNYGNRGSLNASHPAPNYSNNIFGATQLTPGENAASKASLVPNGSGNSAGFNNSFGLMNSLYDSNMIAAQMGNGSYSTSFPPRVDLSSVGFLNANQFSPRLPKANTQDNTAAQPPLQLQQYGLFNNLDNNYIFNAMDLPTSKSHSNMTSLNLFGGKEITNTISQQMGFQFPHQKQSGKEVQNSDYSRLSGLVKENAPLINKESLGQKQGSGKQMEVDPKGKSVVVDETPEENFLLDQEWDEEFPDSLFSNNEHISE